MAYFRVPFQLSYLQFYILDTKILPIISLFFNYLSFYYLCFLSKLNYFAKGDSINYLLLFRLRSRQ
jgi:hypothetical protein